MENKEFKIKSERGVLATNLQLYRHINRMTQEQVAKHLNINRSTYTKYETGVTEPNVAALREIAKLFNIDLNMLIGTAPSVNTDEGKLKEELSDSRSLVRVFTSLNENDRKKLIEFALSLESKEKDEENNS